MSDYMDLGNVEICKGNSGFSSKMLFLHDDPVFHGHYPNYPIIPASLVIDICCEKLCNYLEIDDVTEMGLCVSKASFYQGIRPGDKVFFDFFISTGLEKELILIRAELRREDTLITHILFKKNVKESDGFEYEQTDFENLGAESKSAIDLLPQRFPMLVVDKILGIDDNRRCMAIKYVSYSDYCYRDTCFNDIMTKDLAYPHGGVIEGIQQSSGLLLAKHWNLDNQSVVVTGRINDIYFYRNAYPGEVINFHSTMEYLSESHAVLSGKAMVNENVLLSIDKIFVVKQSQHV